MPLSRYALIVGNAGRFTAERHDLDSPHFRLNIDTPEHQWTAAVNVKSRRWPSQIAACRIEGFMHPILNQVGTLDAGHHPIRYYPKSRKPNRALALDYVRDGLFDYTDLAPIEATLPGRDNDLMDHLGQDVIETRKGGGRVFVWGEPYNNRGHRGIHNVHQNQGNSRRNQHQDGSDQDGAVIFWTGKTSIAYFLVFQSQTYDTRPGSGHSVDPNKTLFDLLCERA